MKDDKGNTFKEKVAEHACRVLKTQIADIRYIHDWANMAGCSKRQLQRVIKAHYGLTAKEKLKNVRVEKIKEFFQADIEISSYELARQTGLKNERELYKFLSRNFNTSFTELKFDLINEGGGLDSPPSHNR